MQKLEKFILSVKYLPTILYFGSVVLLGYHIYCDIINKTEFLNEYTKTALITIFSLMTYLGVKNIKRNHSL